MKKLLLSTVIGLTLGVTANVYAADEPNPDDYKIVTIKTQSQIPGGVDKISDAIKKQCEINSQQGYMVYQYVKEHNPDAIDQYMEKEANTKFAMMNAYYIIEDQLPKDTSGIYPTGTAENIAVIGMMHATMGMYAIDAALNVRCNERGKEIFLKHGLLVDSSF